MKYLVTIKTLATYEIIAQSKPEAMAEAIAKAKQAADSVLVTSCTAEKVSDQPKSK